MNTLEARDGWDACLGRCQSASAIFTPDSPVQCLCHSCRCPDTWTLVARVSVSPIVGHWAEKASVLGHSGSCPRRQCPPSDSATWAPPGTERAVTPISHAHSNLLIAPFFSVSPGTTCAGTPWDRPPVFSWTLLVQPPASTCACSQSLPFENTCATVCQSPGGHLAVEHKRVPRAHLPSFLDQPCFGKLGH